MTERSFVQLSAERLNMVCNTMIQTMLRGHRFRRDKLDVAIVSIGCCQLTIVLFPRLYPECCELSELCIIFVAP